MPLLGVLLQRELRGGPRGGVEGMARVTRWAGSGAPAVPAVHKYCYGFQFISVNETQQVKCSEFP